MKDAQCVYVGGDVEYPTYRSIGDHTEGVTILFERSKIAYADLVAWWLQAHNPFSSCSSSRQYMTGIWWHSDEQKEVLLAKIAELEEQTGRRVKSYYGPVTAVYRAEEYHQRYFEKNGGGW